MPVPEMQKAMSRLRLLLADVTCKEADLDSLYRQFQRQLQRAPTYAIYGSNSLDGSLSIMGEIQERLNQVEVTLKHLEAIKKRAQDELQALELTHQIEQAKEELANLQQKLQQNHSADEATTQEIERLKGFISQSSIRAGHAITSHLEEGER